MSKRRPIPDLRSSCPIAGALDLIGDRWTLVIIRDLMFRGCTRFGELADSPEGITTNILTDRLRRLEAGGIVRREPYQAHPPRYDYVLTQAGLDLFDVVHALVKWGETHVEGVAQMSEQVRAMDPRAKNE